MKKITILGIISLSLLCCNSSLEKDSGNRTEQDLYTKTLIEFEIIFPALRNYNWNLYSHSKSLGNILLEANGVSEDTTMIASMIKVAYEDENGSHSDYILSDILKRFSANGRHNVQKINGHGKVLYHYWFNGDNETFKYLTFISGKYRFLYEERMLNPDQLEFYVTHKDSLDEVKGNDIDWGSTSNYR